jgi:glycosyl transferase family 87
MRTWARAIVTLLFAAAIASFFYQHLPPEGEGTDFPQLYCAAKMVGAGMGHQLYDVHLQWEFQQHYTGRIGNFFIHPAYETLIYLPFAMLPLRAAYLTWTVFNLAILGCAGWIFHRRLSVPVAPELIFGLSVCFAPVMLNFFQGQDSILLLLAFTLTFAAIRQEQDFIAGCLLALGLFKFQFVLPVAVVFLICRRFKFAAGFMAVAACLVSISLWIGGWSSLVSYPKLLLNFDGIAFSGVHPSAISNFRGLWTTFAWGTSIGSQIVIAGLALLTISIAAVDWWRVKSIPNTLGLAISNLVLASLLCSYQASPHDLTLTVIPLLLTFSYLRQCSDLPKNRRFLFLTLLLVIFPPPMHVYTLRLHLYVLLALPLAFLFVMNCLEMRRVRRAPV